MKNEKLLLNLEKVSEKLKDVKEELDLNIGFINFYVSCFIENDKTEIDTVITDKKNINLIFTIDEKVYLVKLEKFIEKVIQKNYSDLTDNEIKELKD